MNKPEVINVNVVIANFDVEFDGHTFCHPCIKCGGTLYGSSKEEPYAYLDYETKLCEFCFADLYCIECDKRSCVCENRGTSGDLK